ncbi:murein L,D-transpeptidase [Litorimonas cladophorae]|uniref:Murein L,D-transpeptidase n=1 Tax=Litorimonas cladophorae TaxID=1220491 RepID=A0A918NHK9_9PROT|nr:L,D-transpeptidase family protein [Litorimonas cladophorae]GGX67782.1 murein L,D-transpeptidase [Litorimonas cladophorae]
MRTLLYSSIATIAFTTTAFATEPLPKDLINHTADLGVATAALGEPKTEASAHLESYIAKPKRIEKIRDEFGNIGVDIFQRAYAAKINSPIWTAEGAKNLQRTVDDLFVHGILADDVLNGDLEKIIDQRFGSMETRKTVKADVKLTLAWMRVAQAMSGDLSEERGMTIRRGSPVVRYSLPTSLLKSAQGDAERELLSMAPEAPQYVRLKTTLADYRQIKRNGGWLAIRDGDAIELGDTDKRVPKLRQRLRAEAYTVEDPASESDPQLFDENLSAALKLFQTRHGLEDDGILGGNTLAALNESVESKIDRIAESMYRWRTQGDLGERYIWANIPSYSAEGWNDGVMEIRQRTIVGKERFATPEFSDEVEYVVANPKWYLPVSIVRRQKVPKLKKDPGYAAKYGYKIFDRSSGAPINAFDVDWTEPGVSRKYRFVQEAGEGNALGEMKIIFPNQYSIYLHGTPGKHLFDRAERAFSSGCVRLEDPVAMAEWIARHDEEAEVSEIVTAMVTEENTRLDLEDNVPVHITYFTVTVGDDGEPRFWRDIYDRYDGGIKYVKRYERKLDKATAARLVVSSL